MEEFKHLDIEKVSNRFMGEWLRYARLQGQWTSAMALKSQAELLGASDAMMKQFDVHIKRIEEQLPSPSRDVTTTAEDIEPTGEK